MGEQMHRQPAETEEVVDQEVKTTEKPDMADIDALLDQIDEVLEENATELVSKYVQRGGQ